MKPGRVLLSFFSWIVSIVICSFLITWLGTIYKSLDGVWSVLFFIFVYIDAVVFLYSTAIQISIAPLKTKKEFTVSGILSILVILADIAVALYIGIIPIQELFLLLALIAIYVNIVRDAPEDEDEITVKITYCKKCGGQLDSRGKCISCGKQYLQFRHIAVISLVVLAIALIGYTYYMDTKLTALNEELEAYRQDEQYIIDMCEGIFNPETGEPIESIDDYLAALEAQARMGTAAVGETYDDNSPAESDSSSTESSYDIVDPELIYIGNMESKIFHRPDCEYVDQISGMHKKSDSYENFMKRGYKPCEHCNP